ncbi:MAG: CcoQ/FixQ family Cbb3-type cytochrome c oxidase assembly chaperone [Bacteroidia bacterium]
MKFINYLESIAGIGIFPLISLAIFFIFFVVLTIWAFKVSKQYITEMKNIPLDGVNNSETLKDLL